MKSKLLIYVLTISKDLETAIAQVLPSHSYILHFFMDASAFVHHVNQASREIDCLILDEEIDITGIFDQLSNHATLLPSVVIQRNADSLDNDQRISNAISATVSVENDKSGASPQHSSSESNSEATYSRADRYRQQNGGPYHSAVIGLSDDYIKQLPAFVDRSIVLFLKLSPNDSVPPESMLSDQQFQQQGKQVLKIKQKDLAQKLKERLGYLGVYYKRDPDNFLRRMKSDERKKLLNQLKLDYREIVLGYFSGDSSLNQKIDNYVNTLFLADVPVAHVVEIHMDLMDEFAKQLQIEGRSEEILLDYRLTLIDLLANLCEIYRRSIPREI